jgi:hypothetical protein
MSGANDNRLTELVTSPLEGFEQVYRSMQHSKKAVAEKILVYFDKVLDHLLVKEEGAEMECIHVYIPLVTGYLKEVILEFLTIKLFNRSLEEDKGQSEYILNRLHSLNLRIENSTIPSDASATKGNKAYKKWIEERKNLKKERDFLFSIPDKNKGLSPNVILNTLIHEEHVVKTTLFATSISQLMNNKRAYILNNTERFTTLIRTLHSHDILKNIKHIILFDCTGRTLFKVCNRTQLEQYKDEDVHIEHLIVISFGKEPFRLKYLINKIDHVDQKHFGLTQNDISPKTYIFQEYEALQLLGIDTPQKNITWIKGVEEEAKKYWQLTETLDVPQLRTIYMFNLFTVATTTHIANRIIEHLFNGQDNEHWFKDEAHEAIAELIEDEKNELKKAVTNLLIKIVEIWATARTNLLHAVQHKNSIALIVPHSLVNDVTFHKEMRHFLLGVGLKMYSWKDIKMGNVKNKFIVCINYRDTGKYPFNIFPSIFENDINGNTIFLSCFLSAFFSKRHAKCEQEYNAQLNKRIKHNFRRKYLGQQDIEAVSVPSQDEMNFDDLDDQDGDLGDPVDTVTVAYNDNSHATFYPSKMLVVQRPEEHTFNVIRADELAEEECKDYKIQLLEELYEDLNLFEIRPEEEKELAAMKIAYNTGDNDKVLWKVLLARKRPDIPDEILYEHVGKATGDDRFVRYQYFREKWLDPTSELLIPRKRRHFRAICEYLELSPIYYRLKLKKSASEKWSKRNNTQKTNRLLMQMFNEGLFNDGIDWSNTSLNHLLTIHDLEENGITEENVRTELQALVALLKENISMRAVLNAVWSSDAP